MTRVASYSAVAAPYRVPPPRWSPKTRIAHEQRAVERLRRLVDAGQQPDVELIRARGRADVRAELTDTGRYLRLHLPAWLAYAAEKLAERHGVPVDVEPT